MGGYLAVILAAPSVVRQEITQKVERTKMVLSEMPKPSLVFLEREQVLVCSSSNSADDGGLVLDQFRP